VKSFNNVCLYILFIILFSCPHLWTQDIGLILDQTAGYGGLQGDGKFDYEGTLIPRYSAFLGDNGEFYISAGIKVESLGGTITVIPELLRTELSWHFDIGDIKAGRMFYSAPLPFIVEGLFDGARFSFGTAMGSASIGAWYTGLLYKNRINITMTDNELLSNSSKLDYSDFANTYFAPQRIISAFDWEYPDLLDLVRVRVALLGQFDLSDEGLNSQYLTTQFTMPVKAFVIDIGGCLEMIQDSGDLEAAFAGELGFGWTLPVFAQSQLSLLGRFSSGVFQPVTTMFQGDVLKARLSGLSMISFYYTARFNRHVSARLSSSFFIGGKSGINGNYPFTNADSGGSFLGNELFGKLYWSPVSDLWLNLGGGVFFPYKENAGNLLRFELNAVLSIY
jgi:hypothetical protein